MRFFFFFLALTLLPDEASAEIRQFRIENKVLLGEKVIASPRVVINDGQVSVLSDRDENGHGLDLRLEPRSHPNGAVALEVNVKYQGKDLRIAADQRIFLRGDEIGHLALLSEDGRPEGTLQIRIRDEGSFDDR